ncbi:hypothetical protein K701_04940 [Streptomyces fradiae ATCC 10745 = DSM 40063]|uniref:Uncharacterized protein n=1 Tax=Streptomyces fradiae ATCC 10745 = DSM 40063 TaxID=1319510 RepID=A0ABQ6Y003_STRFR|nr:hypothetical protein K701_04940 [Streptomyces fradiae ATCC 10745 = DSM 40063]
MRLRLQLRLPVGRAVLVQRQLRLTATAVRRP